MKQSFKVLFHDDGEPIDPRCINRFAYAFPKGYQKVVRNIVENSEKIGKEAFVHNVAALMSSFKMTRKGAFHGVKIDKRGIVEDPRNVINTCWSNVGGRLQRLRQYLNQNRSGKRGRTLVEISPDSRIHIVEKTSEIFEELLETTLSNGEISPVAASKVLFAILPEVALPVDTAEWKYVFETNRYQDVLSIMIKEIEAWEKRCDNTPLETLDPYPKATLPEVYNIMAMAARP